MCSRAALGDGEIVRCLDLLTLVEPHCLPRPRQRAYKVAEHERLSPAPNGPRIRQIEILRDGECPVPRHASIRSQSGANNLVAGTGVCRLASGSGKTRGHPSDLVPCVLHHVDLHTGHTGRRTRAPGAIHHLTRGGQLVWDIDRDFVGVGDGIARLRLSWRWGRFALARARGRHPLRCGTVPLPPLPLAHPPLQMRVGTNCLGSNYSRARATLLFVSVAALARGRGA